MRAGTPAICPKCGGTGNCRNELMQYGIRSPACKRCQGNGTVMQWWRCKQCGGYIDEQDDYADMLLCGKCRSFEHEADETIRRMEDHI